MSILVESGFDCKRLHLEHQGRPELKGLSGGAGSRVQPKSEFSFAEAAYSLGVMPAQRLNTREKCWRVE